PVDLAEPAGVPGQEAVTVARSSYVLCATPRTGSYLVADLMRKTGRAGNPTEYFSAGYQQHWTPRWRVSTYPEYLKRVQQVATTSNGVLGAKAHPRQIRHFARQETGLADPTYVEQRQAVERWLPAVRYVWLRRRDTLRQAVSWTKSMQTNVWWDADVPPAPFDVPTSEALRFDFDYLTGALVRMRREDRMWERFFAENSILPLTIWYEDLVSDRAAAFLRLVDFLGLGELREHSLAAPSLRKQSDSTSERWTRRYAALGRARFEATLSACAGIDQGGPDILMAAGTLERPSGWDESRHSLFGLDGFSGPFKPDYQLGTPTSGVQPALCFVESRASGGPREIVLPARWTSQLESHKRLDARTTMAIALAAHLGADRVGLTVANGAGAQLDVRGCRVLLLGDDLSGPDVESFLSTPPRPPHERRGGALRIVIQTLGARPDWAVSLRNCIAALTRHVCLIVGSAEATASSRADVVITDEDTEGADVIARAHAGGMLELTVGSAVHMVAQPLDWWTRCYRPPPRTGRPIVSVVGGNGCDEDVAALAAGLDDAASVVAGAHRGATIVVDFGAVLGRESLVGLSRGCAVVQVRPDHSNGTSTDIVRAPTVVLDDAPVIATTDPVAVVATLLADQAALAERALASRTWIERSYDFSSQWDGVWAPLIAAGVRR
ncbi:MAG: Stf0 family sulfotransferase, partial [Jatrophihabitans sp.]